MFEKTVEKLNIKKCDKTNGFPIFLCYNKKLSKKSITPPIEEIELVLVIYFFMKLEMDGVGLKEFLSKSAIHLFANGCVPLDRF